MHWKQNQRFNEVEGPWGQEDLYSNRIYSRRRLGEGSLFTRDGESEPEQEKMSNRKVSINYTGLDGFGSLVRYCEDLMRYRWGQLLTDVFAHTLVLSKK